MVLHGVLIYQYTSDIRTKAWRDFTSVTDCVSYLIELYERWLRKENPNKPKITYNITDLYQYVDSVSVKLIDMGKFKKCVCRNINGTSSDPSQINVKLVENSTCFIGRDAS